jgi:hypothetical protein
LPKWIEPRYILEQIKIPQIDYFSFGEKLAVVEQGTNDPEGMGFIYAKIATLLASEFTDIPTLVGNEYYTTKKEAFDKAVAEKANAAKSEYMYDAYISYPRTAYQWVRELLLPALTEYLLDELSYSPKIYFDLNEINLGENVATIVENTIKKSRTFILLFSQTDTNEAALKTELNLMVTQEKERSKNLLFPLLFSKIDATIEHFPDSIKNRYIADFSGFNYEETIKSTKLRVVFGQEVEKIAKAIAATINESNVKKRAVTKSVLNTQISSTEKETLQLLSKEYEEAQMNMSKEDSNMGRIQENIVTRMKAASVELDDQLQLLSNSTIEGDRLAAIAKLQKFPNLNYLNWLTNYIGNHENPFIAYQSCIALYVAIRAFGGTHRSTLEKVLTMAENKLDLMPTKDPQQLEVLTAAKNELSMK